MSLNHATSCDGRAVVVADVVRLHAVASAFAIDGPAYVSFSGGRTSGYMLRKILDAHGGVLPSNVHVIFANTGDELPPTLDFWTTVWIDVPRPIWVPA